MKLRMGIFISIIFSVLSCVPRPHDSPELTSKSKNILNNVRHYLGCEHVKQKYKRKVKWDSKSSSDHLYFSISLYDITRKEINYDSINNIILDVYDENGYELNKCHRVSIFYINNYSRADLRKVYYFDSTRTVIEVAYD